MKRDQKSRLTVWQKAQTVGSLPDVDSQGSIRALSPAVREEYLNRRTLVSGVRFCFCGYSVRGKDICRRCLHIDAATSQLNWTGRQVRVILIGSAACGFTEDATTKSAFERIVAAESLLAAKENSRLTTVGIAVDQDPRVGLKVLADFRPFDELVVGGGILNTGSVQYSVRDLAGSLAVPQVLIVSRSVSASSNYVAVGPDSLHRRLVGTFAIAAWADRLTAPGERP